VNRSSLGPQSLIVTGNLFTAAVSIDQSISRCAHRARPCRDTSARSGLGVGPDRSGRPRRQSSKASDRSTGGRRAPARTGGASTRSGSFWPTIDRLSLFEAGGDDDGGGAAGELIDSSSSSSSLLISMIDDFSDRSLRTNNCRRLSVDRASVNRLYCCDYRLKAAAAVFHRRFIDS